MNKTLTMALVSGALLAGSMTLAPVATAAEKVAPTPVKVEAPGAGKGQIVFFRPTAAGMLLGFTIKEGDNLVAKIGSGSYTIYPVEPGKHTFTIKSETTDTLNMEVEAGETYYVKQTMSMGLMVGHPHLVPSDQPSFDKISAHMHPSTWSAEEAKAKMGDKTAKSGEKATK